MSEELSEQIARDIEGILPLSVDFERRNQIVAIIARHLTSEWQPIETALRDGTEIWAFPVPSWGNSMTVVRWYQDASSQSWVDRAGMFCSPTHWMPLPAPPDAAQQLAPLPHKPHCRIYEAAPGMREGIPCTCAAQPVAGEPPQHGDPFNAIADYLEHEGFQNVIADGPRVTFYFYDQQYEVRATTIPAASKPSYDYDVAANIAWLKSNRKMYAGQWVALRDGEFIDAANSQKELRARIGNTKRTGILITLVSVTPAASEEPLDAEAQRDKAFQEAWDEVGQQQLDELIAEAQRLYQASTQGDYQVEYHDARGDYVKVALVARDPSFTCGYYVVASDDMEMRREQAIKDFRSFKAMRDLWPRLVARAQGGISEAQAREIIEASKVSAPTERDWSADMRVIDEEKLVAAIRDAHKEKSDA